MFGRKGKTKLSSTHMYLGSTSTDLAPSKERSTFGTQPKYDKKLTTLQFYKWFELVLSFST